LFPHRPEAALFLSRHRFTQGRNKAHTHGHTTVLLAGCCRRPPVLPCGYSTQRGGLPANVHTRTHNRVACRLLSATPCVTVLLQHTTHDEETSPQMCTHAHTTVLLAGCCRRPPVLPCGCSTQRTTRRPSSKCSHTLTIAALPYDVCYGHTVTQGVATLWGRDVE